MHRRAMLTALLFSPTACAPTATQQAAALSPTAAVAGLRTMQSRRFDTGDVTTMLQAAIGALQDLGFTIEESQLRLGVLVGTKLAGARIRAQVAVRPAADPRATIVRVTFQRILARPGAMLHVGDTLDEPELYQGFFEKLAQSAFLTAHEI